eukprot:scaffold5122_cov120-Isochrysis_galbana.AAC.8
MACRCSRPAMGTRVTWGLMCTSAQQPDQQHVGERGHVVRYAGACAAHLGHGRRSAELAACAGPRAHRPGRCDAWSGCSVVVLGLRWGVTLTTGLVKNKPTFGANSKNKTWRLARRLPPRSALLLNSNSRCGLEQVAGRCEELADE